MGFLKKIKGNSDFGTHPGRVDMKEDPSGLSKVADIISQIKSGKKVLKISFDPGSDVYNNELTKALKKIGISDIRYGTMPHQLGGQGYTLYKGKKKSSAATKKVTAEEDDTPLAKVVDEATDAVIAVWTAASGREKTSINRQDLHAVLDKFFDNWRFNWINKQDEDDEE